MVVGLRRDSGDDRFDCYAGVIDAAPDATRAAVRQRREPDSGKKRQLDLAVGVKSETQILHRLPKALGGFSPRDVVILDDIARVGDPEQFARRGAAGDRRGAVDAAVKAK